LGKFEIERHILAVRDFVRTYSPEAEPQIAFAWNGKHAEDFNDSNMQFRRDVCVFFQDDKGAFSLPLIAALFKAETLFAREAWGVNQVVSRLAQELLERGGVEYLDLYLAGARCGMDAYMETGNITLSKSRCQELLDQCKANATFANGSEKQWTLLAERFAFLLTK
jgi:hypothetical protein